MSVTTANAAVDEFDKRFNSPSDVNECPFKPGQILTSADLKIAALWQDRGIRFHGRNIRAGEWASAPNWGFDSAEIQYRREPNLDWKFCNDDDETDDVYESPEDIPEGVPGEPLYTTMQRMAAEKSAVECPFALGQELKIPEDAEAARKWSSLGVRFEAFIPNGTHWMKYDDWSFDATNFRYRRAPEPTVIMPASASTSRESQ